MMLPLPSPRCSIMYWPTYIVEAFQGGFCCPFVARLPTHLSLVWEGTQMSLFRYNRNVAVVLNLCDAVSNFYNLLLIVRIKSSTKDQFKSRATCIVMWNSADQISITADELRFLKQHHREQGHQAWRRSSHILNVSFIHQKWHVASGMDAVVQWHPAIMITPL